MRVDGVARTTTPGGDIIEMKNPGLTVWTAYSGHRGKDRLVHSIAKPQHQREESRSRSSREGVADRSSSTREGPGR
jgi:hypothetical protein